MGIIKDFIEYRKVKRLVAEVENIDEEAEAKKQLDDILKKYPHLRNNVLNYAKESEQIEDEIIAETVAENVEMLVNKPKINPEERDLLKVGVKFMGDKGEDLPDKYLDKVATAAGNSKHIDIDKEIEVIKKINDKEKQQEQITKILKRIYSEMDSGMIEANLVNLIRKTREVVENSKRINDMERKIIGKKIAFNYLNYGTTHLAILSDIIPINRMFQINMPKIVENECKEIVKKDKGNNGEKQYRQYKPQKFRLVLLNEMAKTSAYRYNETGELVIPQSEQMRKISAEEEEFFINKMDILTNNKLGENQIVSIKGRIRGNLEEMIKLEEVTNMINNLPVEKRNETVKQMKEIIGDEQARKMYELIKKVGLDKSLEGMEEKSIEDSLKLFKTTLDKRKERVDEKEKIDSVHSDISDDDEMYR